MKKSIRPWRIFYPLVLFLLSCSSVKPVAVMNKDLEEAIAVDSWVFTALQSNPAAPGNRGLDAGYEVKCSNGKLQSYLPYFGRSYSGTTAYTAQPPLDFKTTDYTIQKDKGKKGSWVLLIRPATVPEVREYRFIVFSNGSATLDVTFNNRSPISFTGQLKATK